MVSSAPSKPRISSPNDNKTKQIIYPFWLGGAASCVACTVSHPLDLTKVRLQTTIGANKASSLTTMVHIVKTEGWRGLYSGLSASLLRQATYSTMRFGTYDKLKLFLSKDGEPLSLIKKITCASISGCIGGAFGNPADIVMVRMQNDAKLPPSEMRHYKHALDGLIRIIKEEGFSGLTRGIGPNTNRAILMNSSQLGLVATTICSPVDVIKTRVMNSASKSKNLVSILGVIIREEGPFALFKGWVPSFVRLGPHTVVTFMVLEQFRTLYNKQLALRMKPVTA
ncbi:10217_t:CDS:2 [Entrophospora sp. SA101]|nr:2296_t:CDS:2 [Entrophospora sp. SA101]CAJ0638146.1 8848_t:CDS:2 [Entrophospora sp. SA101]CAJ0751312.1 10217_t:CDS:2 [Entrophospora sp. SA101]CAJ0837731.1 908_t:CDS:2 [Entrophospora sp. SA101]CAJ0887728.1 5225_t:CDS:2 [Entrophospora sp. SA101]